MRDSSIKKVGDLLREKCAETGSFRCSNRKAAKMAGVVKETFRRAVNELKKDGLTFKRVSYSESEYRFNN